MLAIHISKDSIRYAQLVSFKGTPFIESLGKLDLEGLLRFQDISNAEVTRALAEKISEIRNLAEFPDTSTHVVIDSTWFPILIHELDSNLEAGDKQKYLAWRVSEMLESNTEGFRFIHQALSGDEQDKQTMLSLGLPNSLNTWVEKITKPSELEVKNVILDIQSVGDLLSATHLLDNEGNLQLILENRADGLSAWLFQKHEFKAFFQAELDSDENLRPTLTRGNQELIVRVARAVERALKGEQNPDTTLSSVYYFTSSGSASTLTHLNNYPEICQAFNLVEKFNFRDPEFPNIDEYTVVLGALCEEIRTGLRED